MDKLNYSWQSTDFIQVQDGDFLNRGVYIWVFNYDKIPHLGLSVDGKYCSVTIHGAQILEPVHKYFRWIQTKNTPSFFIQLKHETIIQRWESFFEQAVLNNETCLFPIKEALGYSNISAQTLSEFIYFLEKERNNTLYITNQVVKTLYLNHYTKQDVLELINQKREYAVRK